MIVNVHLGLTYKCNMHCKHCFVNKMEDTSYVEKHYKEIIDDLYNQGTLILHYTFGEPLLCKSFFDIAEYVHEKGIYQTLMSNGYYIDEEKAESIKRAGVDLVCVSLDSVDEKKHDMQRGCIGAFKKAVSAIYNLKYAQVQTGIAFTVGEYNVNELDKIYDFALKNSVDHISFLRYRKDHKIPKMSKYLFQDYETFCKRIILQRDKIKISLHDLELLPMIDELHKSGLITENEYEKYKDMNQCHCKEKLAITPNGEIGRCTMEKKYYCNIIGSSIDEDSIPSQYTACGLL